MAEQQGNGGQMAASLAVRHQEHYRVCGCLGSSATCCDPTCECASPAASGGIQATPLEQASGLLGDAIALVVLAASLDKDPRFRALLMDQRDILRAVRTTLGVINVC